MYNGFIIESAQMSDLFWDYIRVEYPDEPEELHSMSKNSLDKLNKHIKAINTYLQEISDSDDVKFSDFESLIEYVLDNYPSYIDRDVLDIYLNNIEGIVSLISTKFTDSVVLLDRFGSTAVIME